MAGERREALQQGKITAQVVQDAIIAQTTLGIWVLDADDRTIWANPQMGEIVGASVEEILGRPVYDFLDPASAEATRVALRRRRTGVAEIREVDLERADGTVVQTLVESMPVIDDGVYAGAVAMVGDITARKEAEREVSMLAALVQSSSNAIIACDLKGTVQSWNPAAEALFGYSSNEMDGRSISMILAAGAEGVVRILEATANGEFLGPLETEA